MKSTFSTMWKSSGQRRKQRKYIANAPHHIRNKFLTAPLSNELSKTHNIKKIPVRTGDKVKIMVGQNKGFEGKVERVDTKKSKVYIEKLKVPKKDGSEVSIPIHASNLMIISLNLDDKKRMKNKSEKMVQKNSEKKVGEKVEKAIKLEKSIKKDTVDKQEKVVLKSNIKK